MLSQLHTIPVSFLRGLGTVLRSSVRSLLVLILLSSLVSVILLLLPERAEARHPLTPYENWAKNRCVQNGGTRSFCYYTVKASRRVSGTRAGWAANPGMTKLIFRESSFNYYARNRYSGACGWYQFLPCRCRLSRMQHSVCGLRYIRDRYGHPKSAWAFWLRNHWY